MTVMMVLKQNQFIFLINLLKAIVFILVNGNLDKCTEEDLQLVKMAEYLKVVCLKIILMEKECLLMPEEMYVSETGKMDYVRDNVNNFIVMAILMKGNAKKDLLMAKV